MIEVTDEDVAEALRLARSKRTVDDFANGKFRGDMLSIIIHAQTIAKLRVAEGALEKIVQIGGDTTIDEHDAFCGISANAIAAINQIKDTGQ